MFCGVLRGGVALLAQSAERQRTSVPKVDALHTLAALRDSSARRERLDMPADRAAALQLLRVLAVEIPKLCAAGTGQLSESGVGRGRAIVRVVYEGYIGRRGKV